MRLLKTILALCLAVLWTGIGKHCQLDVVPGLQFLACDSDAASPSGADPNGCCTPCQSLEAGHYQSEKGSPEIPLPGVGLQAEVWFDPAEAAQPAEAPFLPRTLSRPDLPRAWQFSLRAAALPRAPSPPS